MSDHPTALTRGKVIELVEGPRDAISAWMHDLMGEAAALARKHGIALVGGESTIGIDAWKHPDA